MRLADRPARIAIAGLPEARWKIRTLALVRPPPIIERVPARWGVGNPANAQINGGRMVGAQME